MNPVIVRVLTRLGAGGPPIHATLLTREMRRLGYDSTLVTGRCDAADGDMSYLLCADDPVHYIDELSRSISPWRDAVALVKLYRFIRQQRPDIVHTHTAKAGVMGRLAAKMVGAPVVVHTFHGNVLDGYFSAPANWLIRVVERILALGTDAICALSPQQASELVERFRVTPADKVHVVPLGLDLEPFQALPPAPFSDGKLVAGWLGRFVTIKDIPLLCAVMREICQRTDRVRFVIAGDGPERGRIEDATRSLGPDRCEFVGWQRDIAPVLSRCHVLMQTSRNEGTPVALIQGMAAGRPFVSTAVGGVVDMAGPRLKEAGGCRWHRNGALADPTASAFVSALGEFSGNRELVRLMGIQAREFAAQNYALGALVTRLDRLYAELLVRKKSAPMVHAAPKPPLAWP